MAKKVYIVCMLGQASAGFEYNIEKVFANIEDAKAFIDSSGYNKKYLVIKEFEVHGEPAE